MREVLTILFPYLVLLYLFDCVAHIPRGHLVFLSHAGRRFRLKAEGARAVGLLPTGQAVFSHSLPVFLSAGGVHLPAAEPLWDLPPCARDLRFFPWSEVVSAASRGPDLLVNGTVSATLPTAAAAAGAAAAMRELGASPPGRRRERAEALVAESFDLRSLERVRERIGAPLLGVSILSTLLFLSVYVVLPLALFSRAYQARSLVPLLLAMGLAYVLAIAAACVARKAIAPDGASGRARLVLLLVLLPPGAAHVTASLTRDLFARYDYLTVAASLLTPEEFGALARKELAGIAFSGICREDADLADALRIRERAARRLIADAGVDADRLLDPPRKTTPESRRYCPACAVEYLGGADRCADCGIPLADFGTSDEVADQESACANSGPG